LCRQTVACLATGFYTSYAEALIDNPTGGQNMRLKSLITLGIISALGFSTNAMSQTFNFATINGKWTIVNSASNRTDLGQPIVFMPAFPTGQAYDVVFPFFEGLSALTISDGFKGSHVKVTSKANEHCWYTANIISSQKMTWRLAGSDSSRCVDSMVLELDP
jgi:hypothetical protein